MTDSKNVSSQLFWKGEKSLSLLGKNNVSLGSVTLTRIPKNGGPTDGAGEARLTAQYARDAAPVGSYPINFSDVAQIQEAMEKHSDVAALLFMSLPKLGDITAGNAKVNVKRQIELTTKEKDAEIESLKKAAAEAAAEAAAKCARKDTEIEALKKAAAEAAAKCAQKDTEIEAWKKAAAKAAEDAAAAAKSPTRTRKTQSEERKTLQKVMSDGSRKVKSAAAAIDVMKKWFDPDTVQDTYKTATQQKKYVVGRAKLESELNQFMPKARELFDNFPDNPADTEFLQKKKDKMVEFEEIVKEFNEVIQKAKAGIPALEAKEKAAEDKAAAAAAAKKEAAKEKKRKEAAAKKAAKAAEAEAEKQRLFDAFKKLLEESQREQKDIMAGIDTVSTDADVGTFGKRIYTFGENLRREKALLDKKIDVIYQKYSEAQQTEIRAFVAKMNALEPSLNEKLGEKKKAIEKAAKEAASTGGKTQEISQQELAQMLQNLKKDLNASKDNIAKQKENIATLKTKIDVQEARKTAAKAAAEGAEEQEKEEEEEEEEDGDTGGTSNSSNRNDQDPKNPPGGPSGDGSGKGSGEGSGEGSGGASGGTADPKDPKDPKGSSGSDGGDSYEGPINLSMELLRNNRDGKVTPNMMKSVNKFLRKKASYATTEEEFLSVLNMDPESLDAALRDPEKFSSTDKNKLQTILKSKAAQPKPIMDKIKELRGITSEVSGSLTDEPTVDAGKPESKTKEKVQKQVDNTLLRRSRRLAGKTN